MNDFETASKLRREQWPETFTFILVRKFGAYHFRRNRGQSFFVKVTCLQNYIPFITNSNPGLKADSSFPDTSTLACLVIG